MTSTAVRQIPILFSSPMVRAILDGRKVQTRRVIKPQPIFPTSAVRGWVFSHCESRGCYHCMGTENFIQEFCRFRVGDVLYVRETVEAPDMDDDEAFTYVADGAEVQFPEGIKFDYRPGTISSIHMPKWAARLWLEVTDVRVERLNSISEADAEAEGVIYAENPNGVFQWTCGDKWFDYAEDAYAELWEKINGKTYPWKSNPWVWAIAFKKLGWEAIMTTDAPRASNRLNYANRGRPLEIAVMNSQVDVQLFQVKTGTKNIGNDTWIKLKSPPDFYGSFCATGRLINFDAKAQGEKDVFHFYIPGKKKPRVFVTEFQKQCLMRAGSRGNGIAGLLIEATHPDLACYFWFSWRHLHTAEASIAWNDRRMKWLGSNLNYIDFLKVLEAETQQTGVA